MGGVATIGIANGSDEPWHVMLGQNNVPIVAGVPYCVRLDASASVPFTLEVHVQHEGAPHVDYANPAFMSPLTVAMKTFNYEFTSLVSDPKSQFQFNLGAQGPGVIRVDNIELRAKTNGTCLFSGSSTSSSAPSGSSSSSRSSSSASSSNILSSSSSSSSTASSSGVSSSGGALTSLLSSDGTFTAGVGNFAPFFFVATNTAVFNGGVADFSIPTATTQSWHVQMTHPVALTAGETYSLCFSAMATADRSIAIDFDDAGPTYASVAGGGIAMEPVSTTWANHKFTFFATATDATARLSFNLGMAANPVSIKLDNIGVYRGSTCPNVNPNPGSSSSSSSTSSRASSSSSSGGASASLINGELQWGWSCAGCHGASGQGTASGPKIVGNALAIAAARADLAGYIAINMPQTSKGSCTGTCATDTAAYIKNNYSTVPNSGSSSSASSSGGTAGTALFSENFEAGTSGVAPAGWQSVITHSQLPNTMASAYNALVDNTKAHTGTMSLRVKTDASASTPVYLVKAVPPGANGQLYVRAWVYSSVQLGSIGAAGAGNHAHFMGTMTNVSNNPGNEVKFGVVDGTRLGGMQVTGDSFTTAGAGGTGASVAANTWTCVEYALIDAGGKMYGWVNDAQVLNAESGAAWQNGNGNDRITAADLNFVHFGWRGFGGVMAPRDIWFDDIVVSNAKIGCN